MKRNTLGRRALATVSSLSLAVGMTACSRDYTVAYTYSISQQTGNVSAFNVDYQSGSLTQLAGSPFTTNLSNPSNLIVSPDSKYLYVMGGTQDNKVVQFAIGTDGKLYGAQTRSITGAGPTAIAISPDQKFLYVTYTFQTGYTTISPGPGGVSIFPINSDGSLGTPVNQNLGNNPVGVTASAYNHYVYIIDADTAGTTPTGQILGFVQATGGTLTPVQGTLLGTSGGKTTATGFAGGSVPSAIVIDPTGRFVYLTDKLTNQLFGYTVTGTTSPGSLVPMTGNPYITGAYPVAVTVDPRGKFLYVANFNASTIGSYAIDPASGNPSGVASPSNAGVATGPTCVAIDPALGIYLYTSNRLDNSVSGTQLDPHTGGLKAIANTPFATSPLPSCVAVAANGEHASSLVNP